MPDALVDRAAADEVVAQFAAAVELTLARTRAAISLGDAPAAAVAEAMADLDRLDAECLRALRALAGAA